MSSNNIVAFLDTIAETLENRGATVLAQDVDNTSSVLLPTKNAMDSTVRIKVVDLLQPCLARTILLMLQAKQAHWVVKGENFIALHELFDKIAADGNDAADTIAERIQQLGGMADGSLISLNAIGQNAKGVPAVIGSEFIPSSQMVDALSSITANISHFLAQNIKAVSEIGDEVTSNLLQDIVHKLDKQVWFMEAHLQKAKPEKTEASVNRDTFPKKNKSIKADSKQDKQYDFNSGYWDGYNETMRGHMDRNRNAHGVDMSLHTDKLYAAGWHAGKSAALNGETTYSSEPAFKAYLASIPKKSKTKVLPPRTDLKV